jgi:hypothetical protein
MIFARWMRGGGDGLMYSWHLFNIYCPGESKVGIFKYHNSLPQNLIHKVFPPFTSLMG